MSENNFSLINVVPNFVDKALEEPAVEIGNVLGNIFYSVFSPINFPMKKYRIRKTIELEQYEEDIRTEVSKIPQEKLIEPPLNIVGPALEASKFYISNQDHRKMFARLIAASMNSDKQKDAHPSFIEIIKQLSSNDARLFAKMFQETKIQMPKVKVRLQVNETNSSGFDFYHSILPPDFYTSSSYVEVMTSLENLERLKLIKISDEEIEFDQLAKQLGRHENYDDIIKKLPDYMFKKLAAKPELTYTKVRKGNVSITGFGIMFHSSVI